MGANRWVNRGYQRQWADPWTHEGPLISEPKQRVIIGGCILISERGREMELEMLMHFARKLHEAGVSGLSRITVNQLGQTHLTWIPGAVDPNAWEKILACVETGMTVVLPPS